MIDGNQAARRTAATDTWLEAGWLLVAILIPLWINLWTQQPFELAKAGLLRVLVAALAALWLISSTRHRQATADSGHAGTGWLWAALVLAWLSAQALATAASVDPGLSLWGSYDRGQGLVTLLCYALLFWVVATRLHGPDQGWRLAKALAAGGGFVAGLALAQVLGHDPLGMVSDARSPAYATLGRANFVGGYLALTLPLALGAGLAAGRQRDRLAWWALALLLAGGVAVTGARSGWLAAAAGVIVLAVLWAWPWLPRAARRAAAAGGLAVVAIGMALAWWLGRGAGGSTAARLVIWRSALDLIAARPWLGYGPDGLMLAFPRVFPPELVYYQGRGLLVDRAHSWPLDLLLAGGVIGLLAALAGGIAALMVGRAAARNATTPARTLLLACLAALAANVVGNLASFDVIPTATATALLLGIVAALGPRPWPELPRPQIRGGQAVRAAQIALAAALLVAGLVSAGRAMAAGAAARQAVRSLGRGDLSGAASSAGRARAWWPAEPAYDVLQARVALAQAQQGGQASVAFLAQGATALQIALARRPADFTTWVALGDLYAAWTGSDPGQLAAADAAYRQAATLAPNVATVHAGWGAAFLAAGRPVEAREHLLTAVALDATDGRAYALLGTAGLALGDSEAGLAAYREAVQWAPEMTEGYLGLARCAWLLGRPAEAQAALARAAQIDPASAAVAALRAERAEWTAGRAAKGGGTAPSDP
jgi:tetratricopeptide (TPR) repeat protein